MKTEDAFSKYRSKLPLIEKRSPSEVSAIQKLDAGIADAHVTWNVSCIGKDTRMHLKIPSDMEFTNAELNLAGWVNTYADQAQLSFGTALERIFEYLKRHPKTLEEYTNGDANFAESAEGISSVSLPYGWNVDQKAMETFRRARVYQAGNPARDLVHAVIEVSKGDAEVRARIAALEIENAHMRAAKRTREANAQAVR